MNTEYSMNSTQTSVFEIKSAERRNTFSWGLKGYRPATNEVSQVLRSRQTKSFIIVNTVRDESRWLALYCTDEECTLQFLMQKTGLRRNRLRDFCAHYGVDLKKRNIGGLN